MHMESRLRAVSCGVLDGLDHEPDAAVVDTGKGVAEVHRYAAGEAGCQAEHPLLAAGAGQADVQGGDRGGPGDGGAGGAVAAGGGADEPAGEVGAVPERSAADGPRVSGFVGGDPAGPGP